MPQVGSPGRNRVEATVTYLCNGHAFATDEFGVSYFLLPSHFEYSNPAGFADLRIGTIVHLTPIDHPKGKRGLEILILRA